MAQKKEIINLQVKYGSLDGLNKALDETKKKLSNQNINSDGFKEMSKEVQRLEAAVEKTNSEIEGMTSDKKFMAMNGAIKATAGALTGFTGALGLAGVESEKLGKFQEHAASAISLGMGLKDIGEGYTEMAKSGKLAEIQTKAVSAATKAWTIIQKGFNAVMAMNPLGILITSLTIAAGLIYKFRDSILEAIKSFGPFNFIIDKIVGAFQSMGEAIGLVDDAQTKATKDNIKRMENELAVATAKGEATLDMEKKILLEKRKLLEKGTEEYEESLQAEKVLDAKIQKEKDDAQATADKEEETKRKAKADKIAAEKQKALDLEKANQQKGLDLLDSLYQKELDLKAKSDEEKLALEHQRQLDEIDALQISEEEKAKIKLQAEENYGIKLQELKAKQAEEDLQKTIEREQAETDRQLELQTLQAETDQEKRDAEVATVEEQYNRLIEEAKKAGEDTTTLEKIKAEKIEKIDDDLTQKKKDNAKAEADAKAQLMNQSVDAVQDALGALFGESKAVASANVLVDAGQAAVGIIKSSTSIPAPFNIPFQVSQFALLAATTMKSLQSINSAQPGKGGGGGGGRTAIPTRGAIEAPQAPQQFDAPQTESIQQTVKAYVVSGDVRSSQEADAKINSRRTLGN